MTNQIGGLFKSVKTFVF